MRVPFFVLEDMANVCLNFLKNSPDIGLIEIKLLSLHLLLHIVKRNESKDTSRRDKHFDYLGSHLAGNQHSAVAMGQTFGLGHSFHVFICCILSFGSELFPLAQKDFQRQQR